MDDLTKMDDLELSVDLPSIPGFPSYKRFWAKTNPNQFEKIRAAEVERQVEQVPPLAAEAFSHRNCRCIAREPWVITSDEFSKLNSKMSKNNNKLHHLVVREVPGFKHSAEDVARRILENGIGFCYLRFEMLAEWEDYDSTLERLMNTDRVRAITVLPGVSEHVANHLLDLFLATKTMDALQVCPEIHDRELAAWKAKRAQLQ